MGQRSKIIMRASGNSWAKRALLAMPVLAQLAFAQPAWGWTDSRPAGLVTEVVVDRDGGATVTLRVRWRVLAGRLHTFDLSEIPTDAMVVEATATDAQNAPVAVSTRTPRPGQLEVTLGEHEGMRRGTVDVVLRYTTSLRAQGAIVREGGDAVVRVSTVPWERGLEAAELRIATPTSIQRARWLPDETPGIESTVTSEVGRDVVRAVRRHLPAGTRWDARIACDHSLFSWLNTEHAVRQAVVQRPSHQRWSRPLLWVVAGLAFALTTEGIRRRAKDGTALVPLGKTLGFLPVVLAAMGGVSMTLVLDAMRGSLTIGALMVLVAMLAAAPVLKPIKSSQHRFRPIAWSREKMMDYRKSLPASRSHRLATAVALAGLVATGLAFVWRIPAVSLAGAAATLLAFGALIATRSRETENELHSLWPLSAGLKEFETSDRTQLAWRVRGDLAKPGALRLKLISRRGYRSARGLKAIEWSVRWEPSWLRWEAHPTLTVRAKVGERLEKSLRIAGARVGETVLSKDGTQIAWIVAWSGLEQSVARSLLTSIVKEAFAQVRPVHSQQAKTQVNANVDPASRETEEVALTPDAPQPERTLL